MGQAREENAQLMIEVETLPLGQERREDVVRGMLQELARNRLIYSCMLYTPSSLPCVSTFLPFLCLCTALGLALPNLP